MSKYTHTFEEVEFRGQQICLEAVSIPEWVPYLPATREQPSEGGHEEVSAVYAESFEREISGELVTVKRTPANTKDRLWRELDELAAEELENEVHEGAGQC